MKKSFAVLLLAAALCLLTTACTQNPIPSLPQAEYPMDFLFSSGSGAWGTRLTLNADGSFSGLYHDSDLGDDGPGYPNGTAYICSFTGEFLTPEKLDEHSYRLHLGPVTLARPAGEEWIEEGIRYFSAGPHGLEGGLVFTLYTPDTPVSGLNEDFLMWWPDHYEVDPPQTLNCYGLWNMETGTGFFSNPNLVYRRRSYHEETQAPVAEHSALARPAGRSRLRVGICLLPEPLPSARETGAEVQRVGHDHR